MNPLIEKLFAAMDPTQPSEAEIQAVQAAKESIRAAEQRLTYDEFENLWNAIMDINSASDLDSFTLGFRLGVQLTLEGLRPIGPAEELSVPPYPPR